MSRIEKRLLNGAGLSKDDFQILFSSISLGFHLFSNYGRDHKFLKTCDSRNDYLKVNLPQSKAKQQKVENRWCF